MIGVKGLSFQYIRDEFCYISHDSTLTLRQLGTTFDM